MNDIQQGLLLGKGKKKSQEYKRRLQQCQSKVKNLKNKNNELQKHCNNERESDIRQTIRSQASFLTKEINEIKILIQKFSKDFRDPASKNKIKQLWNLAGKQIQRNKRIMGEFVNRASTAPQFLRRSQKSQQGFNNIQSGRNKQITRGTADYTKQRNGSSLLKSEEFESEIVFQQRIQAQKDALIRELDQKNNKINRIFNQMGEMLGGQQRDMVNQIEANNITAKQNLFRANDQLGQAIVYQRKSKKKYIFLVSGIIILLLCAAGVLYLIIA